MENGFVKVEGNFDEVTETGLVEVKGNTAVGIADDGLNFIVDLTARQVNYCSMTPKTEDEEVVLYNAMNNPDKRIKDCVNLEIEVKDVFVEVVYLESKEQEGVKNPCPRIVLIDKDGVAYQAVSIGMFSALKKIFTSFGTPDKWSAPKKFKVRQISKSADRSILTLDAVLPTKKK